MSAGLTYGVAEVFGHGTGMLGSKALAHGLVSSFMTRARGGKWNSGFWSGFAGTLLSPVTNMARGYYAKVAASAMVSGTVSMISGGKFANGAFSGAFRFMFNEAMHKFKTYVAGFSGTFSLMGGLKGSVGIYQTYREDGKLVDQGWFWSEGEALGADASFGGFFGKFYGTAQLLDGDASEWEFG